jgi:biotin operon repressor
MAASNRGAARLRRVADELLTAADRLEAGEPVRDELGLSIADIVRTQRECCGPRGRARPGAGGKPKLLAYLQRRLGEPVDGQELAAVAGIGEWARRVRELRTQDGYDITELGNSTYRLEQSEPNAEQSAQWKLANGIRRQQGSAISRIETFLISSVGQVVTREQIDYVGKIKEGIRRTRELRDEFGWPIDSHVDDPNLQPGEYRLLSADPADRRDASQRLYAEDVRHRVFLRDDFTCQACGRNREAALAAGDTRFYLEIHHRVAIADEVADLAVDDRHHIENLVTLCHRDHLAETATLQERKRRARRTD